MIEEISISVDGVRVSGTLEAASDSVMVEIQAPFKNLKAGVYFSSFGMGHDRFAMKGKLTTIAIQNGKEILKGLFLVGRYLSSNPELIKRVRKYMARFEKQSKAIQLERKELPLKFNDGEMTKKEFDARMNELRLAENRNVIEKGIMFRQYAAELTEQSGGRADIGSIRDFEPVAALAPCRKTVANANAAKTQAG